MSLKWANIDEEQSQKALSISFEQTTFQSEWVERCGIFRTTSQNIPFQLLAFRLARSKAGFKLQKFHCRKISAPSFASTLKQSPLLKPSSVVVQNEPQTMTPDPSIGSLEDVGSSCKCDPGGLFCAPKLLSTDLSVSAWNSRAEVHTFETSIVADLVGWGGFVNHRKPTLQASLSGSTNLGLSAKVASTGTSLSEPTLFRFPL